MRLVSRIVAVASVLAFLHPRLVCAQAELAQLDPFAASAPGGVSDVPFATATLFDIRFGRLAHQTMPVYDTGLDVLVPLVDVLNLAGFAHTSETAQHVTGRAGRHDTPFSIDASTGQFTYGRTSERLSPQSLCVVRGVVYIGMHALTRLFDSHTDVDRTESALTVVEVDSLPVAHRAARAAARVALQAESERHLSLDGLFRVASESWGGLALDYTLANTRTLGFTSTDYATSLSTTLAGGSVVARTSGSGRSYSTQSAWQRVWPAGRSITQLRIGDGTMGDAGTSQVRGLFLTNAPYARPTVMATVPFDGTLAPGWTVDAYRDGVLVGFDTVGASGQYSLTLPVHYGENPFELVASGPFGERVTLSRAFRALPQLLPARSWEYSADMGKCMNSECDLGAHGELRYGLTSRWSLRAGTSGYTWKPNSYFLHERTLSYVGVSAVPHSRLSVDAEAAPKRDGALPRIRHATVWVDPSSQVDLSLGYESDVVPDGFTSELFSTGDSTQHRLIERWTFDGRVAPGARHPGWELHIAGATSDVGMRGNGRLAAVFTAKSATLRPYLRVSRDPYQQGSFAGLDVVAIPNFADNLLAGWWLHTVSEGGFGAYRAGDPFRTVMTNTEITVARGAAQESHTEAGVRFQHGTRGVAFTMRFVRTLRGFRSSTGTEMGGRPARGGNALSRVAHVASGSLRWDHGIVASPEPVVDRAGVAGVVFLDDNVNGVYDKGERTLDDVMIRVDGYVVRSTADGHYEAWGITPAREALVSIDTASLESPWWVPTRNVTVVEPSSTHAVSLDIPVVVAGIAEGSIATGDTVEHDAMAPDAAAPDVAAPNVATITPRRVTLTHVATGNQRTTEVYSDGTWYQMGLLPGEYEAHADCGTVGTGNLRSNRVRFIVHGGRTTPHVSLSACRSLPSAGGPSR